MHSFITLSAFISGDVFVATSLWGIKIWACLREYYVFARSKNAMLCCKYIANFQTKRRKCIDCSEWILIQCIWRGLLLRQVPTYADAESHDFYRIWCIRFKNQLSAVYMNAWWTVLMKYNPEMNAHILNCTFLRRYRGNTHFRKLVYDSQKLLPISAPCCWIESVRKITGSRQGKSDSCKPFAVT